MEVLGRSDFDRTKPLKENDYGYMDLAEIRNSYPEGKRLAENLCMAYASEYGVPVKVARLTQTLGAGIDYNDNRVFTQFARNIYEKKDIVLHTSGETVRCYCYITDVITALLALLERGENAKIYNVANEKTECSIRMMAEMLCRNYPSSKLIFDLANNMNNYYLPKIKTVLDTSELRQINWEPAVGLEEMFKRLIDDFAMRNIR
jgi:dTDP-glucose 4,6-dehydratase